MTGVWSLRGRTALVTGAGRGLGRGIALELANAGAAVVCAARTRHELDATVAEIERAGGRAVAEVADVCDEDQVVRLVRRAEELQELAIVVAAAGTNRPGPSAEYSSADWDALFDVNVRASFLVCREVGASLLRRRATGSVILMSSQMGSVGYPGRAAYCATKHAVEGLTKALAVEWAPAGIRVNAVAPTFVETPLSVEYLRDPDFRREVLERRLPMGRLASVEDVAYAAHYLASDASRSVTGHTLMVDGGWTAW